MHLKKKKARIGLSVFIKNFWLFMHLTVFHWLLCRWQIELICSLSFVPARVKHLNELILSDHCCILLSNYPKFNWQLLLPFALQSFGKLPTPMTESLLKPTEMDFFN